MSGPPSVAGLLLLPGRARPVAGRLAIAPDGTIAEIEIEEEGAVADAAGAVILPGVLDAHVHVNEPGRGHWEGFSSAGRAAAAGGVTTLVDMPLNSEPVTTTAEALARKAAAAAASCRVDHGFWGGLVPGNDGELDGMLDAGVLGVKCFLVDSGLDTFPPVGAAELRRAMPRLAARGLPLLAHAEMPGPIAAARAGLPAASRRYADWAASRPPAAELEAIELLIELSAVTGCAVHIVHLATAEALAPLAAARRAGVAITVETCPHYLTFAAEDIADGATAWKCAPPIRGRDNREGLWRGLRDGIIDQVASDHSPCPPARKLLDGTGDGRPGGGDFMAAWGGIASLQLLLPALWTEARARGFALADLARWLGAAPARLCGLEGRKGTLAVGYDADLVIFRPQATFTVEARALHHRHPLTPYAGRTLHGRVERTVVRGREVFRRDCEADVFAPGVRGAWLRRSAP